MARFDAFRGIRYDLDTVRIDDVVAPPYDVVTPQRRAELAARSPFSVVHVDQPEEDRGDVAYDEAAADVSRMARQRRARDRRQAHRCTSTAWTIATTRGRATRTIGVIGALEATPASDGAVLPHEQTTPKAKTDRLSLIRATKANLSPIWGLSPAPGSRRCSSSTSRPTRSGRHPTARSTACGPSTIPRLLARITQIDRGRAGAHRRRPPSLRSVAAVPPRATRRERRPPGRV